jgi:hypothetical protein
VQRIEKRMALYVTVARRNDFGFKGLGHRPKTQLFDPIQKLLHEAEFGVGMGGTKGDGHTHQVKPRGGGMKTGFEQEETEITENPLPPFPLLPSAENQ